MALQKHTSVMVYKDPITQERPEGKAVLLSKIQDGELLELWKVCFASDDGAVYERMIRTDAEIIK